MADAFHLMTYKFMISIQDREKIKSEFGSLVDLNDLARFLNTTKRQLIYYSVILPEEQRYSSFIIPKKNGGERKINAPVKTLKYIQSQLSLRLRVLYEPLNVVHGFLPQYESKNGISVKPTIVSNAAMHVRKKFILNIDLENFFPTVSKKRVYGLFKNQYSLNSRISSYLTFICCTDKGLPQGAPTSPIITNMICSRLDRKLRRLSSENYVTYSRYADDLSFSTSKKEFPSEFENKVNEIIQNEGFLLNEKKRRLLLRENRLEVTGLTVNVKPNVQRRYVRNLRAIFHSINRHGIQVAANNYVRIKNIAINNPTESLKKFLNGKIEYLGQVKGKDDPIYIKFKQKFFKVFEPARMIEVVPEPESTEFIDKRNKLLEKYNSEIVSSIEETNDELKNIKKRIKQKLDKARKILLSPEKENHYESIYLIWFSCLNEFQRIHFYYDTIKLDGKSKITIYLENKKIDEKKYFWGGVKLPGYRNIGYLTDFKTDYSFYPDKKVSSSIYLFLLEKDRKQYLIEFACLNQIRNILNLIHSDDINIKRYSYCERVNWIQCSWMFQLLYFIFTSKRIIISNIFSENKYLNNHSTGEIMLITGYIDEIIKVPDANRDEIIIRFNNNVSAYAHTIRAVLWRSEKDKSEIKKNYEDYLNQSIKPGDLVRIKVYFNLSNDKQKNFITIESIEKLPPDPKFLAIF